MSHALHNRRLFSVVYCEVATCDNRVRVDSFGTQGFYNPTSGPPAFKNRALHATRLDTISYYALFTAIIMKGSDYV